MTKASLIALTAVVWTGGFVATGTLVRTLHHPAAPTPAVTYVDTRPAPVAVAPQEPQVEEERVVVLPPIEIVAQLPRAVARPQAPPPPTPSARELHCSEWKPLLQGSGGVQVCD